MSEIGELLDVALRVYLERKEAALAPAEVETLVAAAKRLRQEVRALYREASRERGTAAELRDTLNAEREVNAKGATRVRELERDLAAERAATATLKNELQETLACLDRQLTAQGLDLGAVADQLSADPCWRPHATRGQRVRALATVLKIPLPGAPK